MKTVVEVLCRQGRSVKKNKRMIGHHSLTKYFDLKFENLIFLKQYVFNLKNIELNAPPQYADICSDTIAIVVSRVRKILL